MQSIAEVGQLEPIDVLDVNSVYWGQAGPRGQRFGFLNSTYYSYFNVEGCDAGKTLDQLRKFRNGGEHFYCAYNIEAHLT